MKRDFEESTTSKVTMDQLKSADFHSALSQCAYELALEVPSQQLSSREVVRP